MTGRMRDEFYFGRNVGLAGHADRVPAEQLAAEYYALVNGDRGGFCGARWRPDDPHRLVVCTPTGHPIRVPLEPGDDLVGAIDAVIESLDMRRIGRWSEFTRKFRGNDGRNVEYRAWGATLRRLPEVRYAWPPSRVLGGFGGVVGTSTDPGGLAVIT